MIVKGKVKSGLYDSKVNLSKDKFLATDDVFEINTKYLAKYRLFCFTSTVSSILKQLNTKYLLIFALGSVCQTLDQENKA